MRDQIKQNQKLKSNPTLLDDYEANSEVTQPLDKILAMRGVDNEQIEPGKVSSPDNSAFINEKFFRQPEVTQKARTAMQSQQYDSTIQHLLEYFCEAI